MKKVLSLILICLCLVGCFSGCKQSNDLSPYLSETRDAIYLGSGKEFSLKATCGTRENPLVLDGKVGEVAPYTTFTLLTEIDYNISVAISFDFNTTTYSGQFELSPVNSRMVVNFDINSLGESFIVTVSGKGVNEKINMVKQTVDGLKTPVNAVNSLLLTQPDLIDSYKLDGVFCAEISVRLIIENGSAYYYVGITDTKEKTIAFLLDGVSLETLAKREIF